MSKSEPHAGLLADDPQSERGLWVGVILVLVADLCSQRVHSFERDAAEQWIGTWPSRDFKMVSALAGIDPDALHDRLKEIRRMPIDQRASMLMFRKDPRMGNGVSDMGESMGPTSGAPERCEAVSPDNLTRDGDQAHVWPREISDPKDCCEHSNLREAL